MSVDTYLALAAFVWWAAIWSICILGWRVACVSSYFIHLLHDFALQASDYKAYSLLPRSSKRLFDGNTDAAHAPADLSVQETLPGVAILRPLRGLDCNLYENLQSTFAQEYPTDRLQIICSVADEDDQAIAVVKEVMERYPQVDANIIAGKL